MAQINQTHYPSDERRYTPQELALLWQCNIDTVYELLRRGRLKGFKLGRDWRITESAVRAYEEDPDNQAAKKYSPRTRPPDPAPMRVTW